MFYGFIYLLCNFKCTEHWSAFQEYTVHTNRYYYYLLSSQQTKLINIFMTTKYLEICLVYRCLILLSIVLSIHPVSVSRKTRCFRSTVSISRWSHIRTHNSGLSLRSGSAVSEHKAAKQTRQTTRHYPMRDTARINTETARVTPILLQARIGSRLRLITTKRMASHQFICYTCDVVKQEWKLHFKLLHLLKHN